ncbi:hypothetical protein CF95_gp214 [Erwinia phage PhiEaH1]|jgi:hypothetical protein|uniref:Uncharacterized protein n=1 Tax=Erwinia phage PhiEaH1 TaxID=1401669 RepID=W8CZQ4_9CAUD|nr:hypothetical protein CF95_gp214 [Erwinia phage PhiEaH1]AGX01936.1 hypothetical protein [Erwinia phage PhiEaH1]WBF04874.1 hypothetical protein [Erwinia phage vB_Ea277G]
MESHYHGKPPRFRREATSFKAVLGTIIEEEIPKTLPRYVSAKSIVNNTGIDLYVRERDGIVHRIPSKEVVLELRKGLFYTCGYFSTEGVDYDVTRRTGNGMTLDRTRVSQVIEPSRYGASVQVTKLTHHYFLDAKDVMDKGGVLYLQELDVVVSMHGLEHLPQHPSENVDFQLAFEERIATMSSATSGLMMGVVDNEGIFGTRYINVNGFVCKVSPVTDPLQPSGIYVYVPGNVDKRTEIVFYELHSSDEQCPIKFYPTQAEAAAHGDIFAEAEKAWEREKQDFEKQILTLKNENELKSLERKDYFEYRSLDRKDDSEHLKMFVASAGIIGGAITVISKLADWFRS